MDHLGAEGGQLRRLLEGDEPHRLRVGHHAGIGGHDAVDVLPDLDLRGEHGRADDGGREVRAVAPERRDGALAVVGDVARHDRDPLVLGLVLTQVQGDVGVGDRQDLGLRVGGVRAAAPRGRDHADLPAIEGLRCHALGLVLDGVVEDRLEDLDAEALAERDDEVSGPEGDLPEQADAGQDAVELLEHVQDRLGGRDLHLLDHTLVEVPHVRDVHLALLQGHLGGLKQVVGGLAHGAEHDDGLPRQLAADDLDDALQVLVASQRGAAELHHHELP
mmetsp:Transcript_17243/g.51674  ORF Transcript_17243/g.51674 Transcript_17243/m.51674 type:complete len:275 (+) Transcript_17243:677-1501(+)